MGQQRLYHRDLSISLDCAVFPTCPILSIPQLNSTAARQIPAAPVLSDPVRVRPLLFFLSADNEGSEN